MATPYVSVATAITRSPLLAAAFPGSVQNPENLETALLYASVLVGSLTCRSLVEEQPGDAVPAYLQPVAERAVLLKAEQEYVRSGTARSRRKSIGSGNLASFSAGPYSESYFGPEAAQKAKQLDPDPTTHEALWALATEECREAWLDLWEGRVAPGAALQTFDWGARPGGYGPSWLDGYR